MSHVPLLGYIPLYKTESLRLHSNNDISSQFHVNIMPKKNVTEYRILQKTSNICRHASFVWRPYQITVVLQLWVKSVTHYSRYARYATYDSDCRLIPHIVCNPLQPDPENFPPWSGKYRVSSPELFALYWQSNSSRRWYKTAITNTTTASLHP